MGIMGKSRLSQYKQDRLIEHFVWPTWSRRWRENTGIRPIEAGRQGLHQDHPERFQRHPNVDHGAQGRARQHRLFRQLEGLQRARRVSL